MGTSSENELLAQELSNIVAKVLAVETRVKEVETVIERLEAAAETMARGLEEISRHWEAVYRAMRRVEEADWRERARTPPGHKLGAHRRPPGDPPRAARPARQLPPPGSQRP